MIQSIYTSVNDATIVPCGKKPLIPSAPIPLIKSKYLGEFRTSLEKAKARKNLGIPDSLSYTWGNIEGHIEDQSDLVQYVEQKWSYTSDVADNINSVKDALDYALYFISQYDANTEEVQELSKKVEELSSSISKVEKSLQAEIDTNTQDISNIKKSIEQINTQISEINPKLEKAIKDIQSAQENAQELKQKIDTNTESIQNINNSLKVINTYQSSLSDDTQSPEDLGGIAEGTTVSSLKGKTISEILDILIFPTIVRELVYPKLSYNFTSRIVEVNTPNLQPILTFEKNDAGEETSRNEIVTFNGSNVEDFSTYNKVGDFIHKGTVEYSAGEYLIDNKGQVSNKRVEAGSLIATATVTATYPWYAGNKQEVMKQELIPFNKSTEVTVTLTGNAIIKLPGKNTQMTSFKVDGGLGFLDVDLTGWETSTEEISGCTYKVWTKTDSYSALLPHKINFILKE